MEIRKHELKFFLYHRAAGHAQQHIKFELVTEIPLSGISLSINFSS